MKREADFWVAVIVTFLCALLGAFEAGRLIERKHVAACPKMDGKREVMQTMRGNGDVVCSYVRDIRGLATTEIRK